MACITNLTPHQLEGLGKLEKSYKNNIISCLSGYAGTGKSTIIKHFTQNILQLNNGEVVYVTYTGKASTVLQKKGLPSMTIHSFLYDWEIDPDGNYTKTIKTPDCFSGIKLIVIDEISMVPDELIEDLVFIANCVNLKIVCLGDLGQLPPVSDNNKLYKKILKNSVFNLEQFMRFSENSGIYELSHEIRLGKKIHPKDYGNAKVIRVKDYRKYIRQSLMKEDSQIITTSNNSRLEVNKYCREILGNESIIPCIGDKVIFTQNNWKQLTSDNTRVLTNGTIGTIEKSNSTFRELHSLGLFQSTVKVGSSKFNEIWCSGENFLLDNNKASENWSKKSQLNYITQKGYDPRINYLDFAYAITVHKAQGSEFKNVLLLWQPWGSSSFQKKLLYTGITRASENIIVLI